MRNRFRRNNINRPGKMTKILDFDLSDIVFDNKELDNYVTDYFDNFPDTVSVCYTYEHIPYVPQTYDHPSEGGYNELDSITVDMSNISKILPRRFHDDFKNDIESLAYERFEEVVPVPEYDEPDYDDYEERKLRQYENVNEGVVNFRKRGRDLYDAVDEKLSEIGDAYLVRFLCDDSYLAVSVLRGQNRKLVDDILEEYGFFYYDIGASDYNHRSVITYKRDDKAFESLTESMSDEEDIEMESLLRYLQKSGIKSANMSETQGGLIRIAIDTDEYYNSSVYNLASNFAEGKRMYVTSQSYPATTYIRLYKF